MLIKLYSSQWWESQGTYVRFYVRADMRKELLRRLCHYSELPIKGSAQSVRDEPHWVTTWHRAVRWRNGHCLYLGNNSCWKTAVIQMCWLLSCFTVINLTSLFCCAKCWFWLERQPRTPKPRGEACLVHEFSTLCLEDLSVCCCSGLPRLELSTG